jgi:hypothetical protein
MNTVHWFICCWINVPLVQVNIHIKNTNISDMKILFLKQKGLPHETDLKNFHFPRHEYLKEEAVSTEQDIESSSQFIRLLFTIPSKRRFVFGCGKF